MNHKITMLGALAFCASLVSFAQHHKDSTAVEQLEEVVITDSKFNLKRENSGKVITKITQSELQRQQGKSIAEIINTTSGIEINGTRSNAGQNLGILIRGGRNRQVLVLIDGIAVTDPSFISNGYDLRLLNADQVESIEILKGAASTLYGSGAATAVINIKLKAASKDKIAATFQSIVGTNQSTRDEAYQIEDFRNSVSITGTLNKFNYLASFGNQYTNGLSAISSGMESDPYNATNGNLKLGYAVSKTIKMNAYASFDKFKADFDDAFNAVDSDDRSTTDQYRIGIAPEIFYKNGSVTLNAAYNNVKRNIVSSFPAQFNAESFVSDLYNRYNFSNSFYTVIGINAQENKMESYDIPFGETDFAESINSDEAKFTIIDPYVNVVFVSDIGLNLNIGARLNNHSEYNNHLVYSFNPSFKKDIAFGYIKAMASYSTAYITPSLYQLFEPTYGNSQLQPEENSTFEFGAELNIKDKATLSMVYFNRDEKNFIDFQDLGGFVFQYNNVKDQFKASGLEFTGNYKVTRKFTIQANATYTKVEERLNLRIPEYKANIRMDYQVWHSTFMSLSYQYNDDRKDSTYNSTTFMNDEVLLKSFNLFDFYMSHQLIKNKLTVFANLTNLLNEEYIELFGYSTKGRNINLGLTLRL